MIARYNKREYLYVANRRKKEIITYKLSKTDESFVREGNLFFREVSEDELSDIYDIEFWVTYKADIPNTPEQWKLSNEKNKINSEGILLVFAEGILPGWDVVEKNVCSHRVNMSDISGAQMVISYKKKDGKVCDKHIREERSVMLSELEELFERYSRTAL